MKKKSKFYSETPTARIWKIGHKMSFHSSGRLSYGRVILARIWKGVKGKITIACLDYDKSSGAPKSTNEFDRKRYCFSVKGQSLNIYSISRDTEGKKMIRNRSNNQGVLDGCKIDSVIQLKRLCRVLNLFFRENKFKGRIKATTPDQFNLQLARLLYPGLKEFPNEHYSLDGLYSRHLRHGGIKYLIKKCYGYNSKKLTKLFVGKLKDSCNNLTNLCHLGIVLKGLVTLDDFYPIIEASVDFLRNPSAPKEGMKEFRAFLKEFPRERIVRWMTDKVQSSFYYTDTPRLYNTLKDKVIIPSSVKGLVELHDYLAREQNKLNNPNIIFEYTDKIQELNGLVVDNMEIFLPPDSWTLTDLSQQFQNCVGGYAARIISKDCIILAVKKDNLLTYCVEIRGKRLGQFLGNRNRAPDAEDRKKIVDTLVKLDILAKIEGYPEVALPDARENYQLAEF